MLEFSIGSSILIHIDAVFLNYFHHLIKIIQLITRLRIILYCL